MKISGSVDFTASVQRAKSAIQRQEQLAHFLPKDAKLVARDDGGFDFTVQKDIGPVALRLPGVLRVTPGPDTDGVLFTAKASHILGGSADLVLSMAFSGDAGRCSIHYDGTLDATGLAGRALGMAADKVQARLLATLQGFGRRMEKSQKVHDAKATERQGVRS